MLSISHLSPLKWSEKASAGNVSVIQWPPPTLHSCVASSTFNEISSLSLWWNTPEVCLCIDTYCRTCVVLQVEGDPSILSIMCFSLCLKTTEGCLHRGTHLQGQLISYLRLDLCLHIKGYSCVAVSMRNVRIFKKTAHSKIAKKKNEPWSCFFVGTVN